MITVKNYQQHEHLQTMIERLEHYLKNSSLHDSTITQNSNSLIIHFPHQENSISTPSDNQIQKIRDIVFWNSNIEQFDVDKVFRYVPSLNYLIVNVQNYDLITQFFKTMKTFGITICSFHMSLHEFCFHYKIAGRYHFTYDELHVLQSIIDPTIKNHDSIRIMGFDGIYSIRVTLRK